MVTIPPGPHILSDVLMTSPIVIDEDGAAPAGFSGGNNDFEFGVDPNIDPELALVSIIIINNNDEIIILNNNNH